MIIGKVLISVLVIITHYKVGTGSSTSKKDTALFESRTPADWRAVWHEERHQRCYNDLIEHMNWVCTKDIYRVSKRPTYEISQEELEPGFHPANRRLKKPAKVPRPLKISPELASALLSPEEALSVLHQRSGYLQRRRRKRGIMDECCSDNGCSWEEYAEYCTNTRRLRPRN